ncbi:putative tail terminator protein [Bacillus phage Kirov]|uniref:Putative tail terminator protein n=1 Tax=Bacillus phage Kirov TaxID=2783539 RepID=A0A7S6RBA9_9CAUD|nr:virion structural protein [Bacillus phage Kirov]QOV08240.1 putative tail terminator protein [Bacillus phage Kirov]
MRLDSLSKNVVKVMKTLCLNEGLVKLLANNQYNPFDTSIPVIKNPYDLINPNSVNCKIKPFPFEVEATTQDGSYIRVYYNDAEFNENEVIAETRLHIDIICAKSLWLIEGSMIRPYEILARVTNMVGQRAVGNNIKLKFNGFQHLAVNEKFDAIRLYSDYFTVET